MSNIATAYVQIEPTFNGIQSKIESEMSGAGEKGGSSFGAGFAKVLGGAGGAIGKAGAAVAGAAALGGAAVSAMASNFVSATQDVASYGDNIDKMSQKMGLSAEAYQEWDAVMQHSGTSMETMKASMKTLANAASTGNKAFEELGITQEQIANMSQQDLFEATIAGLQNVEDTTQRTYLAGKLLGKGATELGALLNTSAEDTQAMRDRVRELGGVMSEDAVKAAAAYQDQMQDMQTAFSGLTRNLTAEFLPAMTTVMSGLTEIFSGNSEEGLGKISEGINQIMTGLTDAMPQLLSVATSIVTSLASAIIENIPQLAQAAMDIVMNLGNFIIENLPALIEAAGQVIMQLALGIAQALPTLIPTIVEVVLTIVEYLVDNIDLLIDAAIQLMMGLTLGLIEALPILIEKVPTIIIKMVDALIRAVPKLLEAAKKMITTLKDGVIQNIPLLLSSATQLVNDIYNRLISLVTKFIEIGKNIVDGIKKGISDAWESLVSWFEDKLKGLVDGVKDFFGIESPSKLMADEIGKWIPAGVAKGINEGMGVLDKAVDNMAESVISKGISATVKGIINSDFGDPADGSTTSLYNLLKEYLPQIAAGQNITLEGDAGRLFRLMQRESVRNTELVGTGAVLAAT